MSWPTPPSDPAMDPAVAGYPGAWDDLGSTTSSRCREPAAHRASGAGLRAGSRRGLRRPDYPGVAPGV